MLRTAFVALAVAGAMAAVLMACAPQHGPVVLGEPVPAPPGYRMMCGGEPGGVLCPDATSPRR